MLSSYVTSKYIWFSHVVMKTLLRMTEVCAPLKQHNVTFSNGKTIRDNTGFYKYVL